MSVAVVFRVGLTLSCVAVAGCWAPRSADREAQFAQRFLTEHYQDLNQVVHIAFAGGIPERLEVGDQFDCPDLECAKRAVRILKILKRINIPVFVQNRRCFLSATCSLSFVIDRRGISVSGSSTELVYDEAPDRGTPVNHSLEPVGSNWYYRHIGD